MEYLTSQEVEHAEKNVSTDKITKSVWEIILSNTFTFINGMVLVLAIIVATTGRFENLTFVFVIVVNSVIGSVQEIRSKLALERLELLSRSEYEVNRDKKTVKIYSEEIVHGDYLHLNIGDQIPVDGRIISGQIEVDESLLTGESDSILKGIGEELLSGSNVLSGHCLVKVEAVGDASYINKFAQKTKVFKKYPSKLRDNLNEILKIISLLLIPLAILMSLRGYYKGFSYDEIVLATSGALVGMIPEGLILLVSVSLAVSALKLSRKKVLVEELFCVETLARVDVLCFDKTGTITTGRMKLVDIDSKTKDILENYLSYFDDENATSRALKQALKLKRTWDVRNIGAFSSKNKYSYIQVEGQGTYFFGAAEFLDLKEELPEKFQEAKLEGYRILTLAWSKDYVESPYNLSMIGSLILSDEIKDNTKKTFEYFSSQDVDIKIISGDNHLAVLGVAREAGFSKDARAIDMSQVADDDFREVVLKYDIFGRVTPSQKERMVEILQEEGKTVAMSGDGVNDVLALKKADVSFAMNGATSAAKSVSNIIFLTDDFGVFYDILMEGRRVINNIQKVESLFLIKTFFSIAFSVISILFALRFPFTPIQLTLLSTITVGVPSFFLTFEESKAKVADNFMRDVLVNACIGSSTLVVSSILANIFVSGYSKVSLICLIIAMLNGLLMVGVVSRPLNYYNKILILALAISAIIAVVIDVLFIDKNIASFGGADYLVCGLLSLMVLLIYWGLEKVRLLRR
ncbi:HAD-IC family P-type ATPase [Streptococcaceae bacterium ESL0687]|nr:HAD-IC family P-type ATPase [Streptococcaceae bacterium ESL0687]